MDSILCANSDQLWLLSVAIRVGLWAQQESALSDE